MARKTSGGTPDDAERRSRRPAAELELSAVPVEEGSTEPGKTPAESPDAPAAPIAEPATESPPEPVAGPIDVPRPSRVLPAVLGLIGGLIGGAGATFLPGLMAPAAAPEKGLGERLGAMERTLAALPKAPPAPTLPKDVADRLAAAERAAASGAEREATFRAEIARLESRIAALAERPAVSGTAAAPDTAQLDALRARIASVETAARAVPQALGTLAPKVDSVVQRVEALSADLAAKPAGNAELARAAARWQALGLAEAAFGKGEPLKPALGVLTALGVAPPALAPLAAFEAAGSPGLSLLRERLAASRPKPPAPPAGADWTERLKAGLTSLIEIRRTGEPSGTDDMAHFARAERALGAGNLGAALAALDRLTPGAAASLGEWRRLAEVRQAAAGGLGALKATLLGELEAAAGAKP